MFHEFFPPFPYFLPMFTVQATEARDSAEGFLQNGVEFFTVSLTVASFPAISAVLSAALWK